MKIGIWTAPYTAHFFAASSDAAGCEVVPISAPGSFSALREGVVDVALVDTLTALRHQDELDLYPGAALCFWRFPFAALHLKGGLSVPVRQVACRTGEAQVRAIAAIVLAEHYGMMPAFVEKEDPRRSGLEAWISLSDSFEAAQDAAHVLDLGQDWVELVNYPLVWALFVGRRGAGKPRWPACVAELGRNADALRQESSRANIPEQLRTFYADHLRILLDDVAYAGLTAIQDQLYYNKYLDELSELRFTAPVEEEEDEDAPGEVDDLEHTGK